MCNRAVTIPLLFTICAAVAFSQSTRFRSGVFLHHSTGGCIWGPNGSATSVPKEITAYNQLRGFTGQNTVSLTESGWPTNPWDNEWERWHRIFENRDTVNADIRSILSSQRVIVIKSCYPSSAMTGLGTAGDTLVPTRKSMYNYKWHWRHFLKVMKERTQNFFVIWTNAPLVAAATSDQAAQLSHQFCLWAKDTLTNGLDAGFGSFPANVYVFDFFHKLAGPDGKLPATYTNSSSDSHPNGAATLVVAPQFVREVFDAALAYEGLTSILQSSIPSSDQIILQQNYPNPFNPRTTIRFVLPRSEKVSLHVCDALGRRVATVVEANLTAGVHTVPFVSRDLTSGVYFYTLVSGQHAITRSMVVLR